MTIWQNTNGSLFDDMDGEALTLESWPAGMTQLTDEQATAAQAPTLAQAQSIQVATLQAAYRAAISQTVSFTNAAGVTSIYQSGSAIALNGQTAAQNLSNCITPGAAAWTMGHWLDAANVAQVFTFADLQGLAAAMEAVEVLDWTDLVAKVAAVQAATTVAEVQAVSF